MKRTTSRTSWDSMETSWALPWPMDLRRILLSLRYRSCYCSELLVRYQGDGHQRPGSQQHTHRSWPAYVLFSLFGSSSWSCGPSSEQALHSSLLHGPRSVSTEKTMIWWLDLRTSIKSTTSGLTTTSKTPTTTTQVRPSILATPLCWIHWIWTTMTSSPSRRSSWVTVEKVYHDCLGWSTRSSRSQFVRLPLASASQWQWPRHPVPSPGYHSFCQSMLST